MFTSKVTYTHTDPPARLHTFTIIIETKKTALCVSLLIDRHTVVYTGTTIAQSYCNIMTIWHNHVHIACYHIDIPADKPLNLMFPAGNCFPAKRVAQFSFHLDEDLRLCICLLKNISSIEWNAKQLNYGLGQIIPSQFTRLGFQYRTHALAIGNICSVLCNTTCDSYTRISMTNS